MLDVPTPIVSVIIGEGGSEGALAIGLADCILMQQYAVYSPISMNHNLAGPFHEPILDREAADAMMLTAHDCVELGIADKVIQEPDGGSHLDPRAAGLALHGCILREMRRLGKMSQGKLLKRRYAKFRRMGEVSEYSQEAMTREVELLMSITLSERIPSRASRRRSTEPEPHEAYGVSND
jgi:acetyl-CoA carboxylase carboxyl transferase subunit alpha